ncbi:MAG: hypothetical protein DDT34_02056 [Firmicutes bacterium]|nr:hypothetical protein [Bacillota bacterium]
MHYPVMTGKHLADRWQVSLKTLRRWRSDNEGPILHKLLHHVRNHEADILELERQSVQHWMAILGEGERVPRAVTHPPKNTNDAQPPNLPEPDVQYVSAKEAIEADASLRDAGVRRKKLSPHRAYLPHRHQPRDVIVQASVLPWRNLGGNEWGN